MCFGFKTPQVEFFKLSCRVLVSGYCSFAATRRIPWTPNTSKMHLQLGLSGEFTVLSRLVPWLDLEDTVQQFERERKGEGERTERKGENPK